MRLTKFNPETGLYEYVEKAKTLDEYRAQRKAAIQKLGEYEKYEDYLGMDVYVASARWIETYKIGEMRFDGEDFQLVAYDDWGEEWLFTESDIGSEVFLALEEAEQHISSLPKREEKSENISFYDAELLENAQVNLQAFKERIKEGRTVEFRPFTPLQKGEADER